MLLVQRQGYCYVEGTAIVDVKHLLRIFQGVRGKSVQARVVDQDVHMFVVVANTLDQIIDGGLFRYVEFGIHYCA